MDIEHEFWMYLRERFASYADFTATIKTDKTVVIEWLAQLPSDKRQAMLAHVARKLQTGPCSLIRLTGPRDEPLLNGHYIIVQHLLAKLLKKHRKDVTIEVLASVAGEQLQC
jgi:hypothetical protein